MAIHHTSLARESNLARTAVGMGAGAVTDL